MLRGRRPDRRTLAIGIAVVAAIVVGGTAPARRVADPPADAAAPPAGIAYTPAARQLGASAPTVRSAPVAATLERSFSDRPDEISGPQVHPVYVVAADEVDQQLDVDGRLEEAIWNTQNWMVGRADGLSVRFDTYQGRLDISFFRSVRTTADFVQGSPSLDLREELLAAGFSSGPSKILLMFYNRPLNGVCGNAPNPGQGYFATVKLGCTSLPPLSGPTLTIPHEVVHAIGEVRPSAPHSDGSWHIKDDRFDLMYGAQDPPRKLYPEVIIDRDRDDYWNTILPWLRANHVQLHVVVSGEGQVYSDPWAVPELGGVKRLVPGVGQPPSAPYCDGDCQMWFRAGTSVTLNAVGDYWGFLKFAGWSGACSGRGDCTVTIDGTETKTVTATFVPVVHLQVKVRGSGAVRVSGHGTCRSKCEYELTPVAKASLVASPSKGARFVKWLGACGTRPQCNLTLRREQDKSLTAVFGKAKKRSS